MRLIALVYVATSCLALPTSLAAQFTQPTTGANVYLVTAGQGGDFFTWFGHSALVVADAARGREYWYDYGILPGGFALNSENLSGKLHALVIRSPQVRRRFDTLIADDRSVLVQQLRLTTVETTALISELEADVATFGERGYAYRHISENCTTRIRDIINRVTGGALSRSALQTPGEQTVREHEYRRFAARNLAVALIMDFASGRVVDQPLSAWEESFLPAVLARELERARLADGSALAREVYSSPTRHHAMALRPPEHHIQLTVFGICIGVLALLLALLVRKGRRPAQFLLGSLSAGVSLILGLFGTVIVCAWAMSEYTFTHTNENVLLANPITLAILPLSIAFVLKWEPAARWLRLVWTLLLAGACCAVALKTLPGLRQDNWRAIALILPITLGMSIAFILVAKASAYAPSDAEFGNVQGMN